MFASVHVTLHVTCYHDAMAPLRIKDSRARAKNASYHLDLECRHDIVLYLNRCLDPDWTES